MTITTVTVTNGMFIQWMNDGREHLGRLTAKWSTNETGASYLTAKTADGELHRIDAGWPFLIVSSFEDDFGRLESQFNNDQKEFVDGSE